MRYCDDIFRHYKRQWSNRARRYAWTSGPVDQLPKEFCVLEFPPIPSRGTWTYATCCMSQPEDIEPVELHLFTCVKDESLVELLTAIAHYNRTECRLGVGHTVNFGRPWLSDSICTFGFVSLPYLDGPNLERLELPHFQKTVRCLWLIPITALEVDYAKQNGIEALEQRFEVNQFDYLNPKRRSVV